jgi:hypothetical protein
VKWAEMIMSHAGDERQGLCYMLEE